MLEHSLSDMMQRLICIAVMNKRVVFKLAWSSAYLVSSSELHVAENAKQKMCVWVRACECPCACWGGGGGGGVKVTADRLLLTH